MKPNPLWGGHVPLNTLKSVQGLTETEGEGKWDGGPVVSCCGCVLHSSMPEELWSPREETDNRAGR